MADSPSSPAAAAAMQAAMEAALRAFNTELWTLYSFGVLITCLRTYSRITSVGFSNLRADDYIVWLAVVSAPHISAAVSSDCPQLTAVLR